MSTVGVYIRVSTDKQSTESQELSITNWLKGCEDKVVMYKDSATGRHMARPGVQALRRAVEEGKVDKVVVWRLSRLGRSFIEVCEFVRLCIKHEVQLISIKENIDPSTPMGRAMIGFIAIMDELSREIIVENTKSGLANARAKGKKLGSDRLRGIRWVNNKTYAKVDYIKKSHALGMSVYEISKAIGIRWDTVKFVCETPRCEIRNKKQAEEYARHLDGK